MSYAIFKHSDALFMSPYSEDRLASLSNTNISLIMYICVLIASKYSQIDDNLVRVFEIEKDSKYQYNYKNITRCEIKVLEELNWAFMVQTPTTYTNLFFSAGVVFSDDRLNGLVMSKQPLSKEK